MDNDGPMAALMALLPCDVTKIPPELDGALREAGRRNLVETVWSPDGEEGMVYPYGSAPPRG